MALSTHWQVLLEDVRRNGQPQVVGKDALAEGKGEIVKHILYIEMEGRQGLDGDIVPSIWDRMIRIGRFWSKCVLRLWETY